MTIKVLDERGATGAEIARLLGVSEGAVRYHVRRMKSGAVDGRSGQELKAAAFAEQIEHWRQSAEGSGLNLAALHSWLVREHGYDGSLRSIQRFWKRTFPPHASEHGAASKPRLAPKCKWIGHTFRA